MEPHEEPGLGQDIGPALIMAMMQMSGVMIVIGGVSGLLGFKYGGVLAALASSCVGPLMFYLAGRRRRRRALD